MPNLISKCISSCLGLASQGGTHELHEAHRVAPPQMLPGLHSRGLWRILTGLSRPLKLSILPAEVHRGSQQSLDRLCWQRMRFAGFSLDPEQVALIRGKLLGFGGNLPHWFASPLPQGCHFIGARSPNCRVMRT